MISIERNFDMTRIDAYIERRVEERILEVVALLRAKGLEYTRVAREKIGANKPYTNRTFNLVSSVGFTIARDGQVVESYFPLFNTGSEGQAKGKTFGELKAKELSGKDDIVLVLVAGEDYASYVQGRGFDVISGASDEFEAFLKQIWGAFR